MTNRKKPPGRGTRRRPAQVVGRVQTGLRIERRVLGVLKALADLNDLTLGDLVEGIVLHALDGKLAFSERTLEKVGALRKIFELDLTAADSHLLVERAPERAKAKRS
jgi:hypothetical protein